MALLTCWCGKTNRLPARPNTIIRCGGCKRVFGPRDLVRAVPEERVVVVAPAAEPALEPSSDPFGEETLVVFECMDDSCGWSGEASELHGAQPGVEGRCPECGEAVKKEAE